MTPSIDALNAILAPYEARARKRTILVALGVITMFLSSAGALALSASGQDARVYKEVAAGIFVASIVVTAAAFCRTEPAQETISDAALAQLAGVTFLHPESAKDLVHNISTYGAVAAWKLQRMRDQEHAAFHRSQPGAQAVLTRFAKAKPTSEVQAA